MKNIALTLDLESDHGWKNQSNYQSLENIDCLIDTLLKYDIPLTVFITGKLIKEKPYLVEKFSKLKVEFGLHTYSHGTEDINKIAEIEQAYSIYKRYFKSEPAGYRPAYGIISQVEKNCLHRKGIKYISSLSDKPAKRSVNTLEDMPISKIRFINLPLGLSWVNFLGIKLFKGLFNFFGCNHPLVFYFHMHDLTLSDAVKDLPFYWRLFYVKRNKEKLFEDFENILRWFGLMGYNFTLMSRLAENENN